MSAKSIAILLSPSCFCYRAPISRSRELPVRHLAISPSTVRKRFYPTKPDQRSNYCVRASAAENKVLIVQLGGLTPLIRQMLSPNVEVQCNAVGCITNLATHEENKAKIARSGALGPLTRLAKSKDMRVQRNATGALLNMTHSGAFLSINFSLFFIYRLTWFRNFSSGDGCDAMRWVAANCIP